MAPPSVLGVLSDSQAVVAAALKRHGAAVKYLGECSLLVARCFVVNIFLLVVTSALLVETIS